MMLAGGRAAVGGLRAGTVAQTGLADVRKPVSTLDMLSAVSFTAVDIPSGRHDHRIDRRGLLGEFIPR